MIYIILGTKAQYIKLAPIIILLQDKKIPFSIISTGQHKETMDDIAKEFGIRSSDVVLYNGRDVVSVAQMITWSIKILIKTFIFRKRFFPHEKKGVIIVHGDTMSTVLGALIGVFLRKPVAHIESGLRSFNLMNPFPEEIFRRIVFNLSNIFFCPGDKAFQNLSAFSGNKINTIENTIIDSLEIALNKNKPSLNNDLYALVSLHRFENISTFRGLLRLVECVEQASTKFKVIFVIHKPTERALRKHSLYQRIINNSSIQLRPRLSYFSFINLLSNAKCIITDGGSNQEECAYLGIPTLILRTHTERDDGIGQNIVLSKFESVKIAEFLNNIDNYRRPKRSFIASPSEIIVSTLQRIIHESTV